MFFISNQHKIGRPQFRMTAKLGSMEPPKLEVAHMGNDTCIEEHCNSPAYACGFCTRCYGIRYRAGTLPPRQLELPFDTHQLSQVNVAASTAYCSVCGPNTPVRLRAGARDKRRGSQCRNKISETARTYKQGPKYRRWKSDTQSSRRTRLREKYGLRLEEFDAMMAQQGGTCAICGEPPNGEPLSVDHCHATGQIRGLLCRGCNVGLGFFRDSVERLEQAARYLSSDRPDRRVPAWRTRHHAGRGFDSRLA